MEEYANQHVGGEEEGGARQWQEDVDGLGEFADGAVFLERGGGAVGQWFLDNGLMQDFGILDVNGTRAAYRASCSNTTTFLLGRSASFVSACDR